MDIFKLKLKCIEIWLISLWKLSCLLYSLLHINSPQPGFLKFCISRKTKSQGLHSRLLGYCLNIKEKERDLWYQKTNWTNYTQDYTSRREAGVPKQAPKLLLQQTRNTRTRKGNEAWVITNSHTPSLKSSLIHSYDWV